MALFAGSTLGAASDSANRVLAVESPPRNRVSSYSGNGDSDRVPSIFFGLPSYAASSGYTGAAFSSSTPWISTVGGDGITPNLTAPLTDPFPLGFNLYPGAAAGPNAALGRGLGGGWEPTLQPVYNQNWNFTIQRTLLSNMVWKPLMPATRVPDFPDVPDGPVTSESTRVGQSVVAAGTESFLRADRSCPRAWAADHPIRSTTHALSSL